MHFKMFKNSGSGVFIDRLTHTIAHKHKHTHQSQTQTYNHKQTFNHTNVQTIPQTPNHQRWAPALFSRFRARERESKKERESAKKKEREKSESAERERKKSANSRFFSTQSGNPVSEPKAARQGKS
jgi:hypothetical protein